MKRQKIRVKVTFESAHTQYAKLKLLKLRTIIDFVCNSQAYSQFVQNYTAHL